MNYGERQTALDGLVSLATNHHVLAMFLIVASLLIGARAFGATYFADVNGDSQILHGGIEMAIKQWNKDYRDCSRVPSLVRGEYESREEFDARRQAHVRDCRELERLEGAVLTEPVGLVYDADEEEFTFRLALVPEDATKESYGYRGQMSDYSAKLHDGLVDRRCRTVEGPHTLSFYWGTGTYGSRGSRGYYSKAWAEVANSGHDGGTMTSESDVRAHSLQCLVTRETVFNNDVFTTVTYSYRPTIAQEYTRCPRSLLRGRNCENTRTGRSVILDGSPITVLAAAPVVSARQLKAKEASLRMQAAGTFFPSSDAERFRVIVESVSLVDSESDSVLWSISRP